MAESQNQQDEVEQQKADDADDIVAEEINYSISLQKAADELKQQES